MLLFHPGVILICIGFCGLFYPCYIIACLDSLFSYVLKLKLQKMLSIQVELMGVLNLKNLLKSQRDLAYLRYPNPLLTSVLRTSSSRGRTHLRCQEMLDHSDGLLTHREPGKREMRSQNLMMSSEKCL